MNVIYFNLGFNEMQLRQLAVITFIVQTKSQPAIFINLFGILYSSYITLQNYFYESFVVND